MTPSDLLVSGLKLPPLEAALIYCEGAVDAMFGTPIEYGYPVQSITTDATNEYLDTFRGQPCGYVSDNTARAFKTWNLGSVLIFEDGTCYKPMISRESAMTQSRACWSDLVHAIWRKKQGQNCLCILTTDTKKRLWPRARIGPIGAATPVYLHDGDSNLSECVSLDWGDWAETLATVEAVYTLGWSKSAIRLGLTVDWKRAQLHGLSHTAALERDLAAQRARRDFLPALLIAQRGLEWCDPYGKPNISKFKSKERP